MVHDSASCGIVEESVFVVYDEAVHTHIEKHKLKINGS